MQYSLINSLIAASNNIPSIDYEARQIVVMVFCALMVVTSIALGIIVMMQKGTNDNVGVISGASDTFYGKNKQKGKEAMLKKITFGLFFFIIICSIICFTVTVVD